MKTGMGSTTRPVLLERIAQFLGEAGRRRVWRTAFAYAAVVFVLLQLGEIVFPAFGVPEGALRLLVVACFLGFPLVLALAWAFDITSDGIQRTHSGEGSSSPSGYSGTTLPRLTLLAVIMVTVAGVGWWTVKDTLKAQTPNPSGSSDGFATPAAMEDSPPQVRSLAVLPLEDFSEEEGGEYFTAGFHEELISQLSQIGAARVISRTSVVQYDATGKTMPLIAADLGVEGVVEGSVFRDGDRVRITVQLIHGPTDQHLWANSYDGTLEDAIGLQRRVGQAIAKEIQAELFPEERWETPETRVAGAPHVQEEYMKGRYDQSKATPDFGTAEAVIREAIEAAPESAEAWDALERLDQNPPEPKEEASLRRLESRLEEEGEEGYWSWRMEDLQELEAAVEKRDRNLISLWTDPAWDSVRTDPRFRKIMMDIRRTQRGEGTRFPGRH